MRQDLGFYAIGIVLVNLFVNLLVIFICGVLKIRRLVKKYRKKKMSVAPLN